MQLTKNFNSREFKVSKDYKELASDLILIEQDKIKLFYICSTILQPVRDSFGSVIILSGLRSAKLNKAVGGSILSDHLFHDFSCAVDFTLINIGELAECFEFIQTSLHSSFGQLIYYPNRKFIHVSLPTQKQHQVVFTL